MARSRYRRAVPDARLQVPPNCDLTLGMARVRGTGPEVSVWKVTADERFANPANIVQGGFLAAMCDSAMGAAAVAFAGGRKVFAANAELKVSFLRPVEIGTQLEIVARVISGGKRVAFVEAEVSDGDGTLVAKSSSTYLFRERVVGTGGDPPEASASA